MSRTYRKTSMKSGKPRYSYSKFSQYQEDVKHIEPELMKRQQAKYEMKTITRTEEFNRWNPKHIERRIYVSKGTPLAVKEVGFEYPYYPTGLWYLIPPPWEVTYTFRQRICSRWDHIDWDNWRRQYDHLWVFRHVHLSKTGARGSNAHRFKKRERVRRLRLEGAEYIRNWEDEYHLNQHLEPYNYLLDDYQGEHEWEYEDHWDDWLERETEEDDYDSYDPYEYIYDDWDDWHFDD